MPDKQTKQLIEAMGLKQMGDLAYGWAGSYPILLMKTPNSRVLVVSCLFEGQEARDAAIAHFADEAFRERYQIGVVEVDTGSFAFHFQTSHVPADAIRAFADALPGELEALGAAGAQCCGICGRPLQREEGVLLLYRSSVRLVHSACADAAEAEPGSPAVEEAKPAAQLMKGLAGAVIGALVGTVLWVIASNLGWYSAFLGAAIGFGVQKGYDMLGGRPGKAKLIIVLCVSFAFVLISILASFYVLLNDYFRSMGGTLRLKDFFDVMAMSLADSSFLGIFVEELLVGFLLACAGAMNTLLQLRRERARVRAGRVARLAK